MSKTTWIKRAISRASIIVMIMTTIIAIIPTAQAAVTFSTSTSTLQNLSPGMQIPASSQAKAIVRLGITPTTSSTLTSVTANFGGTGFVAGDLAAIAADATSGVALYKDDAGGTAGSFDLADTVITLAASPAWTEGTTNITLTPAATETLNTGVANYLYVVIKTNAGALNDHQINATIPATTGIITSDGAGPSSSFTANYYLVDTVAPTISQVTGTAGNANLGVKFSEPVQKVGFGNIAFVSGSDPFALVDNASSPGHTISGVTHNVGQDFAMVTMSAVTDSGDFDGSPSTLASASTKIMDMAGNVMGTGAVAFSSPPSITTEAIPSTYYGASEYTTGAPLVAFAAAGGSGPYTFTANSAGDTTTLTNLGLSLVNDSGTYKLTGTITNTPGSYNVTIKVTDSAAATATKPFSINVAGSSGGGVPGITGVAPGSGVQGTNTTLAITGVNTNFSGSTTVTFSGTGVTAGAITVSSTTSLSVPVTIAADATVGMRNLTVTTGAQTVTMPSVFSVVASGASGLTLLFPSAGTQNVMMPPALSFNPTSNASAQSYRVTLKSNSDFTGTTYWDYIFPSFAVSASSHCGSTMCNLGYGEGSFRVVTSPSALAPDTQYYWQVRTYSELTNSVDTSTSVPLESTPIAGFKTVTSVSDMIPPSIFHRQVFQTAATNPATDLVMFSKVQDNLATATSTPALATAIVYCKDSGSACTPSTTVAGVAVGNGYYKYTIPGADIGTAAAATIRYKLTATDGTNTAIFQNGNSPFAVGTVVATSWTNSITGTVKDSTATCEAGVQTATVYIEGTGFYTTTDGACAFTLASIPAGSFDIVAVKTGYSDRKMSGIAAGSTGLAFALSQGAVGGFGGDMTNPRVKFTCPPDGASMIPGGDSNFKICAVFNKEMSQSTITSTNMTVKEVNMTNGLTADITATKGAWTYYATNPNLQGVPPESKMAVWALSELSTFGDNKTIAISISPSVTDTAGNAIMGNQSDGSYVSSFTTGSTVDMSGYNATTGAITGGGTYGQGANMPPHVRGTTPQPGSPSVPTNTPLKIEFSDPMADDGGGYLLKNNVKLYTVSGQTYTDISSSAIDAIVLDSTKKYAKTTLKNTYNSGALAASATYELRILGGAKSATGITISPTATAEMFKAKFTTSSGADSGVPSVVGSYPNTGDTGVPAALGAVNIGFNKDMDPSTITTSSFYLSVGSSTINGSVEYSPMERQAFFMPKSSLSPNTTYTINYTATITGVNGTAITAGTRTFTTGAADSSAPTIQFMNCDEYICAITFSKPMNAATALDTLNWSTSVLNQSTINAFKYGAAGSSSTGTSISLTNAKFKYNSAENTLIIEGLNITYAAGLEIFVEMNYAGTVAKSIDSIPMGSSGNIAKSPVQSSANTGGALTPGETSASTSTMMGKSAPDNFSTGTYGFAPPIEVKPFNTLPGQTTIYGIRLPISKQIPAGGQIVLTFPQGFDISSAQQDTNSPMRGDLNGQGTGTGTGTIKFKCNTSVAGGKTCSDDSTVTGDTSAGGDSSTRGGLADDGVIVNTTSRTVTVYISAATMSEGHDFLAIDIYGIKNSTVPKDFNTSGYTIDVKTKSADGTTVLESLTSMPFFIQVGGDYTLTGTVTLPLNDQTGTMKVYLMSPMTGPSDTTTVDFSDVISLINDDTEPAMTKATYSFTGLTAGEYMVFTDQSVTMGSGGTAKEYNGKTMPEKVSINAATDLASDSATDSSIKYDFALVSATTGTSVIVTVTGPADEPIDIFASSSGSGFKVKQVTLNGAGACASEAACTLKLGNGQWFVGVGPQMPKGPMGGPPPAPSYLPPQPINVGVSDATVTENSGTANDGTVVFALTSADKFIKGIVQDGTGKIIANAEVYAYSPQGGMGTHATAGTDGTFSLGVVDGTYKVGAFVPGMPSSNEIPVAVNSDTAKGGHATNYLFINSSATGISPATALSTFVIKLAKPDYTISGKITDGTTTVQGAGVYAYRTDGPGHANASTGNAGTYTLYVSPGTYSVGAFLPGYGNLTEQTVVVSTENAGNIDFAPSGTGTFYTVSGTVTVGGTATQGIFVKIMGNGTYNEAITGVDGTYTLNVKSGSGYTMKTHYPGQGDSPPVTVNVTENKPQNFTIGASRTVTLTFTSAPVEAFVELKSSTGINSMSKVENKTTTTVSLPDGDYKVNIQVKGVGQIELASIVGADGTVYSNTTGIVTVDGAEGLTVTLPTLRTVTGTVKDTLATIIPDAWVDIGNPSNGMHFGTKAAADGTFTIKVQDSATAYFINAMKPGYFREPSNLTINGSDPAAQIITMNAATATIGGTVKVGSVGVANAFVRGEKLGGGFTATQADANGIFTLPVSAGTWKIFGKGPGYAEAAFGAAIDVTTGATTGKDITLTTTVATDAPKTKPMAPASGGTVDDTANSGMALTVPPLALGSSSASGTVTITPTSNQINTSGVKVVGIQAVGLSAKDSDGNAITNFNNSITIEQELTIATLLATASSTDSSINTKDEADMLQIMYWDESTSNWVPMSTTITYYDSAEAVLTDETAIDTSAEFTATVAKAKLTALTSHFSLFAPGVATDPSAPSSAPSGLASTASTTSSITLGWTLDADATAGYDIYRSTTVDGTYSRIGSEPTVAATATVTYPDSGLSAGTTYYYKITAINGSGESEASSAISAATSAVAVAAPSGGGPVGIGSGSSSKKKTTDTATDTTTDEATDSTADTSADTSTSTATTSTPLKDIAGHWAQTYVENLYAKGIVSGADESHYNPDKPITRAEFTKIVVKMYNIPMQDAESVISSFKDVKESQWYAAFIQAAYDKGIVSGYTDKTFNPNKPITRAEAMKIILSASGVSIAEPSADSKFKDVKKKDWFAKYVEYAAANGIVNGYEDGTFGHNKNITRGEVAKIASLMLKDDIITMIMGILNN
ncbi:MAG: S-layer homology domain-containing protein [Candidatus Peregrinibacteria bacterium]|nr:S-layer homology domain-containing protein [Candidatus Peregrinibacteria bacterium]